jgi:uncharacterized RDD family membrane protein YckC
VSDFPPPPSSSWPPFPGGNGGQPTPPFEYPGLPPKSRDELPAIGRGSPAPILRRAGGLILDNILIFAILVPTLVSPHVKTKGKTTTLHLPLSTSLILWAVPVLYTSICIAFRGQTVGSWLMGVKIIRYIDGGPVQPYQSLIRALIPALPVLIAYAVPSGLGELLQLVPVLIYLSAMFDPLLRSYHDKAAGTIVLRTR